MLTLASLSRHLRLCGIDHVVIAARPHSPTYGRERFANIKIKLNRDGQATPAWYKFLHDFGIKTIPTQLVGIDAGAFSCAYANNNRSITIWTEFRPDQNTITPGRAGITILRVDDNSPHKFGKIRSALVKISNAEPMHKRMTKDELHELQHHLSKGPNSIINPKDQEEHEEILDQLGDTKYKDFASLQKAIEEKKANK